MDLYVTDLLSLDPSLVDQVQQEFAQKLQEAFPEADIVGRGTLHDVVLHLMGVIEAAVETRIRRLIDSNSLLAIEQDPTLADDAVVDAVLSNYRIERRPGAAATGQMTVVVDSLIPVTIPAGAVFSAGGVSFASTEAYSARTASATVVSDTDRVLRPLGNGTYAFTIPVIALTTGTRGALRRATGMAPSVRPPHFVAAYAEGDFAGGWDPESNADLLRRLQEGIAAKAWSNRATVDALIRDQPAFARILHTSIVGFGDPEMVRDRHTIFPVSLGGRCDLYIRTAALPVSITFQRACTLVERTDQGGIWQFSLGRDDAPGFYLIDRVAPLDASPADSGYALTWEARDYDGSGPGWLPDVADPVEAVYSPYQTGTFRFLDGDTSTDGLTTNVSTGTYQISVLQMPLLGDLQDFIAARAVRAPGGDVLVKAPVPCFVAISFAIRKRATVAVPALDPIVQAVADLVNTLGFAGYLHASAVVGVVRDYLPQGAALSAIDLAGRVRRPDGVWRHLRSTEALVIPSDPDAMSTGRTAVFILDPQDVAIDVVDVELDDV